MNKGHKIIASSVFLVISAVLIGYGFTAIDFAFGDDRWSRNGDRTSDFPLIGTMPTEAAFQLGMIALLLGLVVAIIGIHFAIINYSTIGNLSKILGGILLISWGIWGVAFSFNTAEYRITHGIDEVQIPCTAEKCTFTSEQWLLLNFAMMVIGLFLIIWGTLVSRYITKTT